MELVPEERSRKAVPLRKSVHWRKIEISESGGVSRERSRGEVLEEVEVHEVISCQWLSQTSYPCSARNRISLSGWSRSMRMRPLDVKGVAEGYRPRLSPG